MQLVQKQGMLYNDSITLGREDCMESSANRPVRSGKAADGSWQGSCSLPEGAFCRVGKKNGRIFLMRNPEASAGALL